jgi:hypothetical protein
MLEKFIQAVIITFLLYLIAGLSTNRTPTKILLPVSETPTSALSSTFPAIN